MNNLHREFWAEIRQANTVIGAEIKLIARKKRTEVQALIKIAECQKRIEKYLKMLQGNGL